jgi:hypothetical protein
MTRLLLKDVRVSALLLAVSGLTYLAMSVTAVRNDEAFFWLSVIFAVGLWVAVPILEWQNEADRFVCSLPVDRATCVRARALWVLAASFGACGAWVAVGQAWRWTASGTAWQLPATPMWTTAEGLLAFGVVTAVLAAIFLPCYFAAGIGKGSAIFGVLAAALLAAVSGVTALGGARSTSPVGGAGAAVTLPAVAVTHAIGRLCRGLGTPVALVLLAGCAATALFAAIRLATRCYERREF